MKTRILIVEDNTTASKVEKIAMASVGCDVDCAMTGEDGVNLACQNKYDLIIMDIGLPGIDGIKAAELIRASQSSINNSTTPIVAVTANEDPDISEKCLKAGMNEVFSKPFTPSTARELISRFCPDKAT